MFHVILSAALCAFTTSPNDSIQLNRDTVPIYFEGTSEKLSESSLNSIYSQSNEIYRSKKLILYLTPSSRRTSQEETTNNRLRELHKILVQEGADLETITDETLEERQAQKLQQVDRSFFCLLTIESYPYFKGSGLFFGASRANEPPDFDTLIYASSGIPLQLSHKTYLTLDSIPFVEQVIGNQFKQGIVSEEFQYLNDFNVQCDNRTKFCFIIPIAEGLSEKQMVVYKRDSTGLYWDKIQHKGKIAIGKKKALAIPVNSSGIYRVGCISNKKEQSYVINLPEKYGLIKAKLLRKDAFEIPTYKVFGASALAFQITNDADEYVLDLELVQADGSVIIREGIPLNTCLKDKKSNPSLGNTPSLRGIPGFKAPDCTFSIPLEMFQNNLVNR